MLVCARVFVAVVTLGCPIALASQFGSSAVDEDKLDVFVLVVGFDGNNEWCVVKDVVTPSFVTPGIAGRGRRLWFRHLFFFPTALVQLYFVPRLVFRAVSVTRLTRFKHIEIHIAENKPVENR